MVDPLQVRFDRIVRNPSGGIVGPRLPDGLIQFGLPQSGVCAQNENC